MLLLVTVKTLYYEVVLWLNLNFRTSYRKRKIGKKKGAFRLLNSKTKVLKCVHGLKSHVMFFMKTFEDKMSDLQMVLIFQDNC